MIKNYLFQNKKRRAIKMTRLCIIDFARIPESTI